MRNTRSFFVNGEYYDIPEDEVQEFLSTIREGESVQNAQTYDVNGEIYNIPESDKEEFLAGIRDGESARLRRGFVTDDGQNFSLDDEQLRLLAQDRELQLGGHGDVSMSRGRFEQAGIPEFVGRSKADREAFADKMLGIYGEGLRRPDAVSGKDRNIGDSVKEFYDDKVVPAARFVGDVAANTGKNLVFAPDSDWGEWLENNRGEWYAEGIIGANDFGNKVLQAGADIVPAVNDLSSIPVEIGERIAGGDGSFARGMRNDSAAYRQSVAEALPSDRAYVDPSLRPYNDFFTKTPITIGKLAIPGVAAVDIADGAVGSYYDAYDKALKSGQPAEKAEALAFAKGLAQATEGIVLAGAANGEVAKGAANAIMASVRKAGFTGAKMGGAAIVKDVVDQGIEGAENPDLVRAAKAGRNAGVEGALFDLYASGAHYLANHGQRAAAEEAYEKRRAAAEEYAKEAERTEAKSRYADNLGEEAVADIDATISKQVDAGTIPSWRHAEEVKQRAAAKLYEMGGREAANNHENVELAVIEAADEVGNRLNATERVSSPALERRQAEAKMKNNERWAKRSDELAEQYGKEEAEKIVAQERAAEEEAAKAEADANAAHEARQQELESAFAGWKDGAVEKQTERKKGNAVKDETPATAEEMESAETFRDFCKRDPVLLVLDKMWQEATKAIDRGNIEYRARERISELRDEWMKRGEEPVAEKSAETKQETTAEEGLVSDNVPKEDMSQVKPGAEAEDGFRAWAVDRDGKPMEFATRADEQASRDTFDMLVKMGKVDAKTGKPIENPTAAENTDVATETEKVSQTTETMQNPDGDGRMVKEEAPVDNNRSNLEDVAAWIGERSANSLRSIAGFIDDKSGHDAIRSILSGEPMRTKRADKPHEGISRKYQNHNNSEDGDILDLDPADIAELGRRMFTHMKNEEPLRRRRKLTSEVSESLAWDEYGKLVAKLEGREKPIGKPTLKKRLENIAWEMWTERHPEDAMIQVSGKKYGPGKEEYREALELVLSDKDTFADEVMRLADGAYTEQIGGRGLRELIAEHLAVQDAANFKPTETPPAASAQKNVEPTAPTAAKSVDTPSAPIAAKKPKLHIVGSEIRATESAKKTLKERYFQDEKSLIREMNALPPEAKELRAAYETAIADAKRRAERSAQGQQKLESLADDDASQGGKYHGSLDAKPDQPVEMRANDPKRRSRKEVVDWAHKSGRQVIDGMVTPDGMREYDKQMANGAAKAVRRLFPDMDVEYFDKAPEMGGKGKRIEMRNKRGESFGWFEPESKRVVLLPGADAETVAHEIGWHGVRDWAKRKSPELFAKMREIEDNVSPELRTKVLRLYRKATGYDRDMLLNEFGAWTFMGRGGAELEKVVSSKEGSRWYARMLNAAKEMYKDFLTKHGGNRVDLSDIARMNGEELMDHMAKEIASGKTLGEIGTPKATKVLSTKEGFFERRKRRSYDIGTVFRSLAKEIEKNGGGKKNAASEVDEAFALKPGMQEAASFRFKTKLAELKKAYAEAGISHEDFAYYMACKAAAGRDAKVDAKNIKELQDKARRELIAEWGRKEISDDPRGFKEELERRLEEVKAEYESSNGSNINPKEAERTIKEWESGDMAAKTERLRNVWRKIINDTIDLQVESGLVSKEQADLWKSQEPDYVPFKSPIDESTGEYHGRGTNLAKPEHYQAKGRKTAAGDVLTHAMMDWQATESRAIDNGVREKLAKLVEAFPELGSVEKLGNKKISEKRSKDVLKDGRIVIDDGGDPNAVIFKRDGETYVIRLNGTRGTAMASAMTGRNLTGKWADAGIQLPKWLGGKKLTIRNVTRAWASTATSLSPTFAVRNTIKDNIELANIVYSEMGPVKGTKFVASYLKNRESNHLAIMKYITTGKIDASTKSGKVLQDFINDGGMIGGFGNEGYADIAKQLSGNEIAKMMKSGESLGMAATKHVLKSVKYLTEWSELATRVNAYSAARGVGMNGKEAALWSRRAVTDFNRKGELTGVTNVLRMFSNSTTGSTARAFTALTTNKYGALAALLFVARGYLQTMLEDRMNEESDKIAEKTGEASMRTVSEFDRKNSALIIRNGNKEYRVPSHESPFSMLSYVGNCLYRVTHGKMSREKMEKELKMSAVTLAANLSGWGSVNLDSEKDGIGAMASVGTVTAVPSVLQPFAEIGLNMDYAGRQLHRNEFDNETTPHSERGRNSTPQIYKDAAVWLNSVSGGNKGKPTFLDMHPEVLQKIVEGVFKNVGKDVMTGYETISSAINGDWDNLAPRDVFAVRDFKREVTDSTSNFFNNKMAAKKDADEWKKMKSEMTVEERKQFIADHPWVKKSVQDRLNMLYNGNRKQGFRGISDLRKLIAGKVFNGKEWIDAKEKPAKDKVEKWTAELRRKQAEYIRLTGGVK